MSLYLEYVAWQRYDPFNGSQLLLISVLPADCLAPIVQESGAHYNTFLPLHISSDTLASHELLARLRSTNASKNTEGPSLRSEAGFYEITALCATAFR